MREIIFRGKVTEEYAEHHAELLPGDWVSGGISPYSAMPCILCDGGTEYVHVDPDTVGEYTGLTDKNGVRIFEGDIVNYNGTVHEVIFESRFYNARFGIVMGENETWSFGMSVPPNMMEVIGNVHDNPELMGGLDNAKDAH